MDQQPNPYTGTGTAGVGLREVDINTVTTIVVFDRPTLTKSQNDSAQSEKTVFPLHDPTELAIQEHDPLVKLRTNKSKGTGISPAKTLFPQVFSSFNGFGRDLITSIDDNDPEHEKKLHAAVLSQVEFMGFAGEMIPFLGDHHPGDGGSRRREHIASRVYGTITLMAQENINPGDKIEFRLPTNKELENGPRSLGSYPRKVTLQPRVHKGSNLILYKTLSAIDNQFKYLKKVDVNINEPLTKSPDDKFTDPWKYWFDEMSDALDVYFLVRLKYFLHEGYIVGGSVDDVSFRTFAKDKLGMKAADGTFVSNDNNLRYLSITSLPRIAKHLGHPDFLGMDNLWDNESVITNDVKKKDLEAKRQAMEMFFFDSTKQQLGLGQLPPNPAGVNHPIAGSPGTQFPPSITRNKVKNPWQRLTQVQMEKWKCLMTLMDDVNESANRFVKGRAYSGAPAGSAFQMFINPP